MVKSGRRKSFLGILALLAGAAALVLLKFIPTGISTVTVGPLKFALPAAVGLGALLVASIAFLAAATSPRTGTGLPIFAVLICGTAVALAYYPNLLDNLMKKADKKAVPVATPAATAQQPSEPAQPKADAPQPPHAKTIFDVDYPSSTPTPSPKKETPAPLFDNASVPSPKPVLVPPVKIDNSAAIRAAHAKVESARAAAVQSLESSPNYQAAKAASDAADANLTKVRAETDAGSPERIEASQAAMEAHGKLQKMITDAMARDPAAQDASQELKGLQGGK